MKFLLACITTLLVLVGASVVGSQEHVPPAPATALLQSCNGVIPTLSAGWGTSPSIVGRGNCAFDINVGTGGTATNGTLTFPSIALNGWSVVCADITTESTTVFFTKQTSYTATTAVVTNFNNTPAAAAWAASDHLVCQAVAF